MTVEGWQVFQIAWAFFTFWVAVARVKGGVSEAIVNC